MSKTGAATPRSVHRATAVLAIVILVPCFLGFGTKFVEFVATWGANAIGVFVVMPVVNYLAASFGFLMLLFWAMGQGMFRNVEGPKYEMLEQEWLLDADGEGDSPDGSGGEGGLPRQPALGDGPFGEAAPSEENEPEMEVVSHG